MPAEGLPWLNRADLLSYEEIERLVRLLSAMGVHDVRLTGGEPLVRRDFPQLVAMLGVPAVLVALAVARWLPDRRTGGVEDSSLDALES